MNDLFTLHKEYLNTFTEIEAVIKELFEFKKEHYTEANLSNHSAYLSDVQNGRTSCAFAISFPEFENKLLPHITVDKDRYPKLFTLAEEMYSLLDLNTHSTRVLFNIQEYYDNSAPVPKHYDGELMDFEIIDNKLKINEAIRPESVALMTLINNTSGGTRIHRGKDETVIAAKAGDLLIFNNADTMHSVDELIKNVETKEGDLIRLTFGWRSLSENCYYQIKQSKSLISSTDADELLQNWTKNVWPQKWKDIQNSNKRAAF